MSEKKIFDLSVYFILDPSLCAGHAPEDVARAAIAGGITMLQYRDKSANKEMAEKIRALTRGKIPFLMNDHVEIARAIDADGVHIGQGDMNPQEARKILGTDKIIGLTAFTEDHIRKIDLAIVDYIGTGPVYPTKTDKGKPVLGVENFAKLTKLSPVPVVGIGGITPANAKAVKAAGAVGVAMMRAISESADPRISAESFAKMMRRE